MKTLELFERSKSSGLFEQEERTAIEKVIGEPESTGRVSDKSQLEPALRFAKAHHILKWFPGEASPSRRYVGIN